MTMLKLVIQNLSIVVVVVGMLLFIAAGTMGWPQAWVFQAVFFGCGLSSGFWLLKTNPELLDERMKSPLPDNHKPRDRAVRGVLYAALCVWLVLMALDARRFGWSSVPIWAEAIGGVLVVGAFYSCSRVPGATPLVTGLSKSSGSRSSIQHGCGVAWCDYFVAGTS